MLHHHPGKANVVADALLKATIDVSRFNSQRLEKKIFLGDYNLQYYEHGEVVYVYNMVSTLSLVKLVQTQQLNDEDLRKLWERISRGEGMER